MRERFVTLKMFEYRGISCPKRRSPTKNQKRRSGTYAKIIKYLKHVYFAETEIGQLLDSLIEIKGFHNSKVFQPDPDEKVMISYF